MTGGRDHHGPRVTQATVEYAAPAHFCKIAMRRFLVPSRGTLITGHPRKTREDPPQRKGSTDWKGPPVKEIEGVYPAEMATPHPKVQPLR